MDGGRRKGGRERKGNKGWGKKAEEGMRKGKGFRGRKAGGGGEGEG